MSETKEPQPISLELGRLNKDDFFQENFSGMSDPTEIARLLDEYRKDVKQTKTWKRMAETNDEPDELTLQTKMLYTILLFNKVFRGREFADNFHNKIKSEIKAQFNKEGEDSPDRSIYKIITDVGISPFVLRCVRKEDIPQMEIQLNDSFEKEDILGFLWDYFTEVYDVEALLSNPEEWERVFSILIRLLESYPVKGDTILYHVYKIKRTVKGARKEGDKKSVKLGEECLQVANKMEKFAKKIGAVPIEIIENDRT